MTTRILSHISDFSEEIEGFELKHKEIDKPVTIHGVNGKDMIRFAGLISHDDLTNMTKTVQADCEQVDTHEW